MASVPYAHSLEGQAETLWEPLEAHLSNVADRAGSFAAAFGSHDWGKLAGLWHDLGKYDPRFQARIRGENIQVEHAGLGAALAAGGGQLGYALAAVIAGHHTGLANVAVQGETTQLPLMQRINSNKAELERLRPLIPPSILNRSFPSLPGHLIPSPENGKDMQSFGRRVDFWTRMLFSALVDADFLATEAFYDATRREAARRFDSLETLQNRLDEFLGRYRVDSPVNEARASVLESCRYAAQSKPGLFSLTVPTGGGKTLSSMAFALCHAIRHGLRRVIVVIPYTSIIEQNAQVYRSVFGEKNVIEHHSNIDEARRLEENREAEVRRRLAAENWDAPIIVTTNVQFFESLFANRPSRCRKLHNIARSVVILDEVQNLPTLFLNATLDAMRELTENYGCSLVLMTATQPALRRRAALPAGLEDVREIIDDPDGLSRALQRVRIHWPDPEAPPTSYAELAESLRAHEQALAIVHLRKDARRLAEHLPSEARLHLSALMCAAHRTEILGRARSRLRNGEPCLLVATQLVEAGVDISFPVVYRALAGLDSLAQAAGRCNREGELRDESGNSIPGDFHVFRAETRPPAGILRMGMETMVSMLREYGTAISFSEVELLEAYFRMLYSKCETDAKGIQTERANLNFATVAQRFQLIEDGYSQPIVVPWSDSDERVTAFRKDPNRETQRALQPYIVQMPERELDTLVRMGAAEMVHESLHVLTSRYRNLYHEEFGLIVDENANSDPEALMA